MSIIVRYPQTIIKVHRPDKLVIVTPQIKIVKIQQGPPGPRGQPGNAGTSVEVIQSSPSTTWTITHGLGRRPAGYKIYDFADTIYEAGAIYVDDNTVQFTFSAPISGRVVIV